MQNHSFSTGPVENSDSVRRTDPDRRTTASGAWLAVRGVALVAAAWWVAAATPTAPRLVPGLLAGVVALVLVAVAATRPAMATGVEYWAAAAGLLCSQGAPLVALGAGLAALWAVRCLTRRAAPVLGVWLGVAGTGVTSEWVNGASGTAAGGAVVTLVLAGHAVHHGPAWVCAFPEAVLVSSTRRAPVGSPAAPEVNHGSAWSRADTPQRVRQAADEALSTVAAAASAVVLTVLVVASGTGALRPLQVPERAAVLVLWGSLGLVLVGAAATARLAVVRWSLGTAALASGSQGVLDALAWGGSVVGYVLLVVGPVCGWIALAGRRTWDLCWWPAPHPGVAPWCLALAVASGVVASGLPRHLLG